MPWKPDGAATGEHAHIYADTATNTPLRAGVKVSTIAAYGAYTPTIPWSRSPTRGRGWWYKDGSRGLRYFLEVGESGSEVPAAGPAKPNRRTTTGSPITRREQRPAQPRLDLVRRRCVPARGRALVERSHREPVAHRARRVRIWADPDLRHSGGAACHPPAARGVALSPRLSDRARVARHCLPLSRPTRSPGVALPARVPDLYR